MAWHDPVGRHVVSAVVGRRRHIFHHCYRGILNGELEQRILGMDHLFNVSGYCNTVWWSHNEDPANIVGNAGAIRAYVKDDCGGASGLVACSSQDYTGMAPNLSTPGRGCILQPEQP